MAKYARRSAISEGALRRLVAPTSVRILNEGSAEAQYVAIAPQGRRFASGQHRLVAATTNGRGPARDRLAELVRTDRLVECDDAGCRACLCTCNPAQPANLCLACMGIKEL